MMTTFVLGSLTGGLLGWLMGFLSVFLIMLVLIQRGKGGGLTGALGGPGGQSAFGSKAGDTFTLITIVVASIWAFTCAFTMWLFSMNVDATIAETNMQAGPGDDTAGETDPGVTVGDGFEIGGAGLGGEGLGPATGDDSPAQDNGDADDQGTPSMELTPGASDSEAVAGPDAAAESGTTPTDESQPADESQPTGDATETSEADDSDSSDNN